MSKVIGRWLDASAWIEKSKKPELEKIRKGKTEHYLFEVCAWKFPPINHSCTFITRVPFAA